MKYDVTIKNNGWVVTDNAGKTKFYKTDGLYKVWSFLYRGMVEMKIHKVINNNVLSAFDSQGHELVVMGRGIGFKAKSGDIIDESKIEKIFHIESSAIATQFQEKLSHIPLDHMEISADIIAYAQNECNMKLNQGIYVALTDHINFAIERFRKGYKLENALLWETRQFYHKEYLVGEYALRLIAERLNIHFPEDEAGFIALHFVNAQFDVDVHGAYDITNIIQMSLAIIKREFDGNMDETSMHYERLISHLKFFARRLLYSKELLPNEEEELSDWIRQKYPAEYACAQRILDEIGETYQCSITREEITYLAIHIKRVLLKE